MNRARRGLVVAGVISAFSYLSIGLTVNTASIFWAGYSFGSLFTHTTLASVWAALGPGKLRLRLAMSLLWVLALPPAIALSLGLPVGYALEAAFVYGIALFAQWLLIQIVLLPLVLRRQAHIGYLDETSIGQAHGPYQLRILDILAIVTLAAAACGLGRMILPYAVLDLDDMMEAILPLTIVVIAQILIAVPLFLTSLLRLRVMLLGIAFCLALLTVGTYLENLLITTLAGPDKIDFFVAMNASTAVLTLIIGVILRLHGFRLHTRELENNTMHQTPPP